MKYIFEKKNSYKYRLNISYNENFIEDKQVLLLTTCK